MAGHQVVEIAAQGTDSRLTGGDGGIAVRYRALFQLRQQLFYRIGKFGNTVQSDNGQCAVGLVHARAGFLQTVASRIRDTGDEALSCAFQRKIDFSLDPGQRTNIQIHAHTRQFSRL